MDYEKVLIFGAHPDDEIFMAGTVAKLAAAGARVVVVTCTDGCEGYPRPEMKNEVVQMRRAEAAHCNEVLGIARRVWLGRPDMALVNDKQTLHECIRAIRQERPDAIFADGPLHPQGDHVAAGMLAVEARYHAGEPVAVELGEPWHTPHLYYYTGVAVYGEIGQFWQPAHMAYYQNVMARLPRVDIDVSQTAHKVQEGWATQVSQHTIMGTNAQELLAEAEQIEQSGEQHCETFWLAEHNALNDFLPRGLYVGKT